MTIKKINLDMPTSIPMMKNVLSKVFNIKTVVLMFTFASLSFAFRFLITTYLSLDINIYTEFLMGLMPSVIASKILVGFMENIWEQYTTSLVLSPTSGTNNHISNADRASGNNANSGGSGSNNAGASGSRNNPIVIRSPSPEDEAAVRARAEQSAEQRRLQQEDTIARNKLLVETRSALLDEERKRDHYKNMDDQYPYKQQRLARFLAKDPAPHELVTVADPEGIGVRGFMPRGVNQPYATNIANSFVKENISPYYKEPYNLDPNAKRFLVYFLKIRKVDVYGISATKDTISLVSNEIVKLLNNSN